MNSIERGKKMHPVIWDSPQTNESILGMKLDDLQVNDDRLLQSGWWSTPCKDVDYNIRNGTMCQSYHPCQEEHRNSTDAIDESQIDGFFTQKSYSSRTPVIKYSSHHSNLLLSSSNENECFKEQDIPLPNMVIEGTNRIELRKATGHLDILPNLMNSREFVRSKTVSSIPVNSLLGAQEIQDHYNDGGPAKSTGTRRGSQASPEVPSSRHRSRLLSHLHPGRSRSAERRRVGESPCQRKKAGAAWAPADDEDDTTHHGEFLAPSVDEYGHLLPGSPHLRGGTQQLFYTTPPKQMSSTHSEFRSGDGRLPLSPLVPRATTPTYPDSSTAFPESPSLPNRLSRGSTSPNLSSRLGRRASGSKLRRNPESFTEGLAQKADKKKRTYFDMQASLFEAVEFQDLELVTALLRDNIFDINSLSSEDLTALDIAIMSNYEPMVHLLLQHGAQENPKFQKPNETRLLTLINLINEAERNIEEYSEMVKAGAIGNLNITASQHKENEKQLHMWQYKHSLLRKMKQSYDNARFPDPPTNVSLMVHSSTSIQVRFNEPKNNNGAVVTRYRVEWSENESFSPLAGQHVLSDPFLTVSTVNKLTTGTSYYFRVFAWNMKGFSAPCASSPSCATPSSWREVDSVMPRGHRKLQMLENLFSNVKEARPANATEIKEGSPSLNSPVHSRKSNMRRSLKNLFSSAPKFQKTLKRGLYLSSVFFNGDKVIVTNEEYLPVIEIDESFNKATFYSDFHWLLKVSCTWEDVKSLRVDMERSSNSSAMLLRSKMLQAVSAMQAALGLQDLGQFYYQPVRDANGSTVLVTVAHVSDAKIINQTYVKWMQLHRLQQRRNGSSSSTSDVSQQMEPLISALNDFSSYTSASNLQLPRGLYLGYLKLKSSVDLIKILTPQNMPNIVPHIKIRDQAHVSREEWEWLRKLSLNDVRTPATSLQLTFQNDITASTKKLLERIGIDDDEAVSHRLYDLEVIEITENVSMILLMPPVEGVCSAPGHSEATCENPHYLNLPVQVFEMSHMSTYNYDLISLYSRISSILELDTYLAQQSQREAFSSEEINDAKERVELLARLQQQLDDVWKGVRWTMDIIAYARDKNIRGGLPLSIIYASPSTPNPSPVLNHRDMKVHIPSNNDVGYHSDRSSGEQSSDFASNDTRSGLNSESSVLLSSDNSLDVWQKPSNQPATVRVNAAYDCGLPVGTSLKLHLTPRTTSREVINLVVQHLNRVAMIKGLDGPFYLDEQLMDFCLVAVIGARERVLRDDYQPLQLQNPWKKGQLFVRLRRDKFAALEQGHVSTV